MLLALGGFVGAENTAPAPTSGVLATTTVAATTDTSSAAIDHLVETLNPNIWTPTVNGQKIVVGAADAFTAPASDIARRTRDLSLLTIIIFIPFLVLPLVLLLYVVFKFRDRGDGRVPATFMSNHKLEVIWTAIPIFALLLIAYPLWLVLDFIESPPAGGPDPLVITVVGKRFAWGYEYKGIWKDPAAKEKQAITIGQDVSGQQEAVVLPKGQPVVMNFTSNDVNHSWWVPAFGVKKDCIQGRFTRAWFTPDTLGAYKGQCVELCGQGHSIMVISAVVVDEPTFATFSTLARFRDDIRGVWTTLSAGADHAALTDTVSKYLSRSDTPERRLALRYWIASNYACSLRAPQGDFAKLDTNARTTLVAERRGTLDGLLAAAPVASPVTVPTVH